MSEMLPNNENRKNKNRQDPPFGELIRSMQGFLNEKPVRGFLQSIDEFFKAPFPGVPGFTVETADHNNEYVVTAELPGVKREQIQINIQGNLLTISVENHGIETEEDDVNQIYRKVHSQQHTSRTIPLPQTINDRKIKATYRDGLLEIRIPQEKGKSIHIDD
jgi:HSP20 family protein